MIGLFDPQRTGKIGFQEFEVLILFLIFYLVHFH